MGYECRTRDFSTKLGAVFFLLLVLAAVAVVNGTPFDVPGRTLASQHKQMRYQSFSSIQTQQILAESGSFTFRLSDGDVVSCIPIDKQPAVNQSKDVKLQLKCPTPFAFASVPRLQNYFEKMKPSMSMESGSSTGNSQGAKTASQLFAKEFGACPEGRIPVRNFRRPGGDNAAADNASAAASANVGQFLHEHAYTATIISRPPAYKGTEVIINVWQPFVEPSDFSLAQLWVMNTGLSNPPGSVDWALNTMEAGWQVYSDLYGDKRPRLFIYWTGDGYVKTGCYNLNQDCGAGTPGFIQVSNKILLGGSLAPPSKADSSQYEFKLRIFKDDESGNWWLEFNNEYVGYWPSSLFHSLRDMSDLIQWGGEIFDTHGSSSGNTNTSMGSGELSTLGFKKAAYQRNLQYVRTDNKLHDVRDLQAVTTNPSCYTVTPGNSESWGTYFYYGGRC